MILNGIDNHGTIIELAPPADKTGKVGGASQKDALLGLQRKYLALMETCAAQQTGGTADAAQCTAAATEWFYLAAAKFLAEQFFTRDNRCFEGYTEKKAADENSYFVRQFEGVMIHSPASFKSGLENRDIFNKYSKNKDPKGTHFVVDGNSGKIYCLLPLHCLANHCGRPMETSEKAVPGTKSLNGKLIAIDIGEPDGTMIIDSAVYASFPKSYQSEWTLIGHHYYGVAEKLSNSAYNKLSKEKKEGWIKAQYETEKKDKTKATVTEWFRTTPALRQTVLTGAKNACQAAAELTASLCYLLGRNPLGTSKKLTFDKEKEKYRETEEEVPCVVIGHVEGHKSFYQASNHGDPENLWRVEKIGYTMDTFRAEVAQYYDQLQKKELPIHPLLDLLAHQTYEARLSAEGTAVKKPAKEQTPCTTSEDRQAGETADTPINGQVSGQTSGDTTGQQAADTPQKPFVPFESWAYSPPTGEEKVLIDVFRRLAEAIADGSGKTPQDYYQSDAGISTKKAAAADISRFDKHLQALPQLYPPEIAKELLN